MAAVNITQLKIRNLSMCEQRFGVVMGLNIFWPLVRINTSIRYVLHAAYLLAHATIRRATPGKAKGGEYSATRGMGRCRARLVCISMNKGA